MPGYPIFSVHNLWYMCSVHIIHISVHVLALFLHAVLFVFLFFFTTPPILVASINNIKFIKDIEGKIFNRIQVNIVLVWIIKLPVGLKVECICTCFYIDNGYMSISLSYLPGKQGFKLPEG